MLIYQIPARVKFVNPDGTLTAEAQRFFGSLIDRVGGLDNDTLVPVFSDIVQPPNT